MVRPACLVAAVTIASIALVQRMTPLHSQADVLIHVVDVSGTTNEKGEVTTG